MPRLLQEALWLCSARQKDRARSEDEGRKVVWSSRIGSGSGLIEGPGPRSQWRAPSRLDRGRRNDLKVISDIQHDQFHKAARIHQDTERRRIAPVHPGQPGGDRRTAEFPHRRDHDYQCADQPLIETVHQADLRPQAGKGASTTLTTNASRHHAVTSSTAAQVKAIKREPLGEKRLSRPCPLQTRFRRLGWIAPLQLLSRGSRGHVQRWPRPRSFRLAEMRACSRDLRYCPPIRAYPTFRRDRCNLG